MVKVNPLVTAGLLTVGRLASLESRADELLLNGQTNIWLGPVTNDCSAEVERNTEYKFNAGVSGNGSIVGNTNDWFEAGSTNRLTAIPGLGHKFRDWTGTGIPVNSTSSVIDLVISQVMTNALANFTITRYDVLFGDVRAGVNSTNIVDWNSSFGTNFPYRVLSAPGVRHTAKKLIYTGTSASTNSL